MLTTALALTLTMQAAPNMDQAVETALPTYWVTEYPIIIKPLVDDYRRCLNYADRRFRREADFAEQHAADIPRCEKLKAKLVRQSEEALRQGRWSEVLAPEKAGDVFRTVAEVHVSRGRDFDRQLMRQYAMQEARMVPTDLTNEVIPNEASN
ncbi:hypothetical protein [Altererythrobacter lutimaris]|uniref:Uncharacterized protein n=1 Tax=Altererythrobacter lutimaris TaxID=2743979 RepID=A0A850H7V8_9SPHN|nr:hypothetical protein [Altererythrobacter lutimaris]NVE95354.1 hypothetical protein [Altererythrobacter lutimaris]